MVLFGAGQFTLVRRLGGGAFGEVFLTEDRGADGTEEVQLRATKLELQRTTGTFRSHLQHEFQTYMHMRNHCPELHGIPNIYGFATEGVYTYLVMDYLGPSLEELFTFCNRAFDQKTVLLLADQMICRVELIHALNIIHRDIKPENFVMGTGVNSDMVYLVDFGLARTYKRSNVHLECQEGRQLAGTARYVSLATHRGLSQSRRDDLECLALVLIYLSRGNLPWEGIRHQDKATKHQRIYQSKLAHTPDVLCEGLKPCFAKFLLYARSLKYDETPDYDYCRRIFRDELDKSYGDGADSWIDDGEVSSNYGGLTFCWNDWNTGGTSDEEDEETIRIESLRSSQIAQSSQNATTQETGKQASPPGYNASFSE